MKTAKKTSKVNHFYDDLLVPFRTIPGEPFSSALLCISFLEKKLLDVESIIVIEKLLLKKLPDLIFIKKKSTKDLISIYIKTVIWKTVQLHVKQE